MASRPFATLGAKVRAVEKLLGRKVNQVFECPTGDVGYRMKISARVTDDRGLSGFSLRGEKPVSFAFNDPVDRRLRPISGDVIPIAHERINAALPTVKDALSSTLLGRNVFEAKFQTTMTGELALTLCYRAAIPSEAWGEVADNLRESLLKNTDATFVSVLGRSQGQLEIVGRDFLLERFTVDVGDGQLRTYDYKQNTESFSQPNAMINEMMLSWAVKAAKQDYGIADNDLLELYCGNGNFTIPLADNVFGKVLAGEVGRVAVRDAIWAAEKNGLHNVTVVRLSAEEVADALFGQRLFERLRAVDLDEFKFRTVFVDPPRAGLDSASLELLAHHEGQIIYVSCNPVTLQRDVEKLSLLSQAEVVLHDLVCFDQFPGTDHIECGVAIEMQSRRDA